MAYRNAALTGRALLVSGNYFEVLGVGAAMGRVFDESDDRQPGGAPGGRAVASRTGRRASAPIRAC